MLDNRFWSKVKVADTHFYNGTPCWEWTSNKTNDGYGRFHLNGKKELPHRVYYQDTKGKIPNGLELDHLCRNHACLNLEHLQAITHKENMKRGLTGFLSGLKNHLKTHCPHGHEYNEKNTYIQPSGSRMCRTCGKIKARQIRQRKKMEIIQ